MGLLGAMAGGGQALGEFTQQKTKDYYQTQRDEAEMARAKALEKWKRDFQKDRYETEERGGHILNRDTWSNELRKVATINDAGVTGSGSGSGGSKTSHYNAASELVEKAWDNTWNELGLMDETGTPKYDKTPYAMESTALAHKLIDEGYQPGPAAHLAVQAVLPKVQVMDEKAAMEQATEWASDKAGWLTTDKTDFGEAPEGWKPREWAIHQKTQELMYPYRNEQPAGLTSITEPIIAKLQQKFPEKGTKAPKKGDKQQDAITMLAKNKGIIDTGFDVQQELSKSPGEMPKSEKNQTNKQFAQMVDDGKLDKPDATVIQWLEKNMSLLDDKAKEKANQYINRSKPYLENTKGGSWRSGIIPVKNDETTLNFELPKSDSKTSTKTTDSKSSKSKDSDLEQKIRKAKQSGASDQEILSLMRTVEQRRIAKKILAENG